MSSSARKVVLHSNVVGKLKEPTVLVTVSTREPACFGRVQNKASRDAAHDILSGDVRVVPLIPNGLHDVLKAVVADELSPGQGPLLIGSKATVMLDAVTK